MTRNEFIYELSHMDPDDLFKRGSITFIYDQRTDNLYHENYPETHHDMLNAYYKNTGDSVAGLLGMDDSERLLGREDALKSGFILGRVGRFRKRDIISLWGKRHNTNELDRCLKAIIKEFPHLDNGNVYVINHASQSFFPFQLKERNLGKNARSVQNTVKESPECGKETVLVDGKPMSLEQIVASIHNLPDFNLKTLQRAFCGDVYRLITLAKKNGCQHDLSLINYIQKRLMQKKLTCQDGWNDAKKAGKQDLKQDLRAAFKNPDREFRTQREIDQAWDYLQKENKFPTFTKWLNEAQRRNNNTFGSESPSNAGL